MRRATCRAPEGVGLQTKPGDRPMKETITSFVGLDVHKDSIAIAVAQAGRQAPRFIGTVVPRQEPRRTCAYDALVMLESCTAQAVRDVRGAQLADRGRSGRSDRRTV